MCKNCDDYRSRKFGARISGKGKETIEVEFTLGELEDLVEAITERAMKTKDVDNLKIVACFTLSSKRLEDSYKERTMLEGKYKGFREAIQEIVNKNDTETALDDLKRVVASNEKVDKLLNDLQEIGIL